MSRLGKEVAIATGQRIDSRPTSPARRESRYYAGPVHLATLQDRYSTYPTQFETKKVGDLQYIIAPALSQLVRPDGILASDPDGPYCQLFTRDADETADFLLAAKRDFGTTYVPVDTLQGALESILQYLPTQDNLRLGKRRGKMMHQVGTRDQGFPGDWEDHIDQESGVGVIYDSVDATPRTMTLIDDLFPPDPNNPEAENRILTRMRLMTEWAITNIKEHDGLVGYTGANHDPRRGEAVEQRQGLETQTWQDCWISIVDNDGNPAVHPIKPIEEHAITWVALNRAADRLKATDPHLSKLARKSARRLKETFNAKFLYKDDKGDYLARAIDGKGEQINTVNIDVLNTLGHNYKGVTILDDETAIPAIIRRSIDELYDPIGGLRTQSPFSKVHEKNIYHGSTSFWPHAIVNASMTCEAQAKKVRDSNPELYEEYHGYALELATRAVGLIFHFGTAIETCQIFNDGKIDLYRELDEKGIWHTSAERQVWVAAAGVWAEGFLQKNGVEYITFPKEMVRGRDDDSIRRHAVAIN